MKALDNLLRKRDLDIARIAAVFGFFLPASHDMEWLK